MKIKTLTFRPMHNPPAPTANAGGFWYRITLASEGAFALHEYEGGFPHKEADWKIVGSVRGIKGHCYESYADAAKAAQDRFAQRVRSFYVDDGDPDAVSALITRLAMWNGNKFAEEDFAGFIEQARELVGMAPCVACGTIRDEDGTCARCSE